MRPAKAMGIEDSLEEEVLIALVRAAAGATARSNAVATAAGLSPSQYNVLRILRAAEDTGLTCAAIGNRMVTRDSDLTRLPGGLADKGLLTRAKSTEDARRSINRLTARGRRLLEQLDEQVTDAARASLAHMGRGELRALLKLLTAVLPQPVESAEAMGTRAASIT